MRAASQIGRNDECHCGSGLKYKKCCLDKDLKTERDVVKYITNIPELSMQYGILPNDPDIFIYPWERPGFRGVGKYRTEADVQEESPDAKSSEIQPQSTVE